MKAIDVKLVTQTPADTMRSADYITAFILNDSAKKNIKREIADDFHYHIMVVDVYIGYI